MTTNTNSVNEIQLELNLWPLTPFELWAFSYDLEGDDDE